MVSREQLDAVRAALEGVELDDGARALDDFSRDESGLGPFPPQLVVFPKDTGEVQAVFRACQAYRVPLTPVGARSGKSGGSLPVQGGVALSLERMNRILAVHPEDLIAIAQPGVVLEALHQAAEAHGLFYPPDPNSSDWCTLGGTVAENAGGPRAVKYGVTRDYVLGLEWVLPNGEVLRPGRRTHKGVAGYDLVGLFVGSEGTLGVATEVTVKLLPRPRVVMTALLPFGSVLDAARGVGQVLVSGLLPRCLELLDDVALAAVRGKGYPFPAEAGACVIAEVDGHGEDAVLAELQALAEVCTKAGAREVVLAQNADQRARVWEARKLVSPSLRAMKAHKLSEDVVVPRSRVPEAIARFKAVGAALGLTVATYGHAGDGNLHTNVLWDTPEQRPLVDDALRRIMEITVELQGTITGEHGVGLAKRAFLPLELTPAMMNFQRSVKAFFDPLGLINPGKVF
ncbi:MAG: FAD-linked oxidase C-terminal domain-containing protein [Myxococcota bacterium]|jgi:glycolate oxidase